MKELIILSIGILATAISIIVMEKTKRCWIYFRGYVKK
jgi:hypothetical protein